MALLESCPMRWRRCLFERPDVFRRFIFLDGYFCGLPNEFCEGKRRTVPPVYGRDSGGYTVPQEMALSGVRLFMRIRRSVLHGP